MTQIGLGRTFCVLDSKTSFRIILLIYAFQGKAPMMHLTVICILSARFVWKLQLNKCILPL